MEILRNKNNDQKILISPNQDFKVDLGWGDAAEQMDKEILYTIINPVENYETVRFIDGSQCGERYCCGESCGYVKSGDDVRVVLLGNMAGNGHRVGDGGGICRCSVFTGLI